MPLRRWICVAGLVIALAGCVVYSNSLGGSFTFDDIGSIAHNPTIQQGWWDALHPPPGAQTVSSRPLVNLSVALNYQLGGLNVWGYHAFNLVIQLLAGLTLFGLVRRTLLRTQYRTVALPLAFVIALLWTVHPLQTESVSYVVQRAESMMGLFYFLTLYCFIRGVESSRTWTWYSLSAIACVLGMVTKETMATAPLMTLLYDRTFVAGTFAGAWRQRWRYYATLACSWAPLAWIVIAVSWPGNFSMNNPAFAGLSPVMKSCVYALKQCEAVVRYLLLSFWPHPLVFNYGAAIVTNPLDVAPQMFVLALLMGATLYALWRRPKLGFLGAWFFVILAPTSSVMPLVGQTMAEHHMYLSLAAPVVLMALGLHAFLGRHGFAAGVVLALALGGLTFERNRDYYTTVSLGADILRIRPDDATSQNSLAVDLQKSGRLTDAVARENSALRMAPDTAEYYYNLGNTYHLLSKPGQARDAYLKAVNLQSDYADAHNNLANIYMIDFGLTDKAMAEYEAALRDDPNYTSAHVNLGNLYIKSDRAADAIPRFNAAIRLQPDFGEAYFGLGDAFLALGRSDDAIPPYETAVRFMPDYAPAHNNLGVALFQMKRIAEAVRQFEETVRLDPDYPHAQENLAKSRPLAPPPPGGVKPLAKPSPLDGPRK